MVARKRNGPSSVGIRSLTLMGAATALKTPSLSTVMAYPLEILSRAGPSRSTRARRHTPTSSLRVRMAAVSAPPSSSRGGVCCSCCTARRASVSPPPEAPRKVRAPMRSASEARTGGSPLAVRTEMASSSRVRGADCSSWAGIRTNMAGAVNTSFEWRDSKRMRARLNSRQPRARPTGWGVGSE